MWQEPQDPALRELIATVRKFAANEVAHTRVTHEKIAKFPTDLVRQMGELGVLGLTIPEVYGGLGLSTTASTFVAYELAHQWPAAHLIWGANASLAAEPIINFGTEEQRQRILPRLASGEILGCYGLTEPNAGSDAAALQLRATPVTGGWKLNGAKIFITNAGEANVAILFARTQNGITGFILETKLPGLKHEGVSVVQIQKRVMKSSHFYHIYFNDAFIPNSGLLGEEGKGFAIAMKTLDGGRINIAAQAVAMGTRLVKDCHLQARERKMFKQTLLDYQSVQFDLAASFAELAGAWALTLQASEMHDRKEDITMIGACAKLVATETASQVGARLGPHFGGMGVTEDLPLLEWLDDIHVARIYEGASAIQKTVIYRRLQEVLG